METRVNPDKAYAPSENVVFREIEGEHIIVPLASGIGDMEEALFTLNETGAAIWQRMNGKTSLNAIIAQLSEEFEAKPEEIEVDVLGLVGELLKRRMLVQVQATARI